jgi:hypothetical protein
MRRRPTTQELLELERATLLALRAEEALHDPAVTANDLVRLQRLATQARDRCAEMIRRASIPSLSELRERHRHA